MNQLILIIPDWPADPWLEALRELMPERPITVWPDHDDLENITYALAWKPPAGALASLPGLKVIFSLGAGVDHLLGDPALPHIPIVRIVEPDLTARMSEYVVLHVLMHHRRQRDYDDLQRLKSWQELSQPAARHVRVGILGLGELGSDAGRKLALLGFDVAGWSLARKQIADIDSFAGADELPDFLARSDILVCLLPLTKDTFGILNKELLAKLPHDGALKGPVLINAGRGGLQVERDIIEALRDNTLYAATLDVFEQEPLAQESPLWEHPRVTITPHIAAVSDPAALSAYIASQIARFENGRALENIIDRKRGY